MSNPHLHKLQPYPFEKLRQLLAGAEPPESKAHIPLSIGEPKHAAPDFALQCLFANADKYGQYPASKGLPVLREAIAQWLKRRFNLSVIDPENNILPLQGTREGLFAIAQVLIEPTPDAVVVMPNPFYQIYEGAALLAGAKPYFANATLQSDYLADYNSVPEDVWRHCQMLYLCTPGNPSGAIVDAEHMWQLIELADKYDFTIVSDECYSEIYLGDEPPVSILEVCAQHGRDDYARCLAFHSLSKRSNLAGLRSGFVAGDAKLLDKFALYRTYHGCALPVPTQFASALTWGDEKHVQENRDAYRAKFAAVAPILAEVLPVRVPEASFFIWLETPVSDETFCRELFEQQHITVLPGSYLARDTERGNPGANHVRIALVADQAQCVEAAHRIVEFVKNAPWMKK
jgi:N-succinyldiaminopimelate aminotransferase